MYMLENSYFNILKIIKRYLEVFKKEEKFDLFALYLSIGLPAFLTLYVEKFIQLTDDTYEKILLVITILTALFFFGARDNINNKRNSDKSKPG